MPDDASPWNPLDPFVCDADGCVVGLRCLPPHHARLLAAGWVGGHNLDPLVVATPDAFTADVLTYHRRSDYSVETLVATLPDEPPFVYQLARPVRSRTSR